MGPMLFLLGVVFVFIIAPAAGYQDGALTGLFMLGVGVALCLLGAGIARKFEV